MWWSPIWVHCNRHHSYFNEDAIAGIAVDPLDELLTVIEVMHAIARDLLDHPGFHDRGAATPNLLTLVPMSARPAGNGRAEQSTTDGKGLLAVAPTKLASNEPSDHAPEYACHPASSRAG